MQVQKPDAGAVTSAPPARWHAGWVATFGPRGDTGTGAQAWRGADRSLVLGATCRWTRRTTSW